MVNPVDIQAAMVIGFVAACLDEHECNHTFRWRDEAIGRLAQWDASINEETICDRLAELGGQCCDCEILLNAAHFLFKKDTAAH